MEHHLGGSGDIVLEQNRIEKKANRISWFRGGIVVGFQGKGIGNILARDMQIENAEWLNFDHLKSSTSNPYYLIETSSIEGIRYAHSFNSLMEESEEEKKKKSKDVQEEIEKEKEEENEDF